MGSAGAAQQSGEMTMGHQSACLATLAEGQTSTVATADLPSRDIVVLVVEDAGRLSNALRPVCDFIGVAVEVVGPQDDISALVRDLQPVSIVSQLDTQARDCCSVMHAAAAYDRGLPILIVAKDDEDGLLGVVDAVEDLFALTNVNKVRAMPGCGDLADFLLKACHRHGRLGLMPL